VPYIIITISDEALFLLTALSWNTLLGSLLQTVICEFYLINCINCYKLLCPHALPCYMVINRQEVIVLYRLVESPMYSHNLIKICKLH